KAVSAGPQSLFDRLARISLVDVSKATGTPKTVREEPIEIDGSKYSCWVVETRIDKQALDQPPGAELKECVVTVWIDKDLKIERQITLTGKFQGEGMPVPFDLKQKTIKRAIKFDVDLPDSLFSFTPPEHVVEVDDFSNPGMKPSNLVGKHAPAFQLRSL